MNHWKRLASALGALALVVVFGTVGYLLLGFGFLDALFQTVTTVSTVGFREIQPLTRAGQVFTMALIVLGVGAAFYAFGVIIETFVEGQINELLGRRRMDRSIAGLEGHVVVCGAGRVGRSIGEQVAASGKGLVVIDIDADAAARCTGPTVVGDATEDDTLRAAGIERAGALVAAVETDANNSFIVLSARALNPDLFIVARARSADSEEKLRRAGADRVVNPQSIGGSRMAAFVLHPNVAEFVDVVMHEGNLEFRLEEITVPASSPLAGRTLRDAHIRDETGALVLALRSGDGAFLTNPPPDTALQAGQVMIAIGTQDELDALAHFVAG